MAEQAKSGTTDSGPSPLEQLLDVERLVTVFAKHAYGGHSTSWRSALVLLERLYPNRWEKQ